MHKRMMMRCRECGKEVVGAQGASTHFRKAHDSGEWRGQFTIVRPAKGQRAPKSSLPVKVRDTTPKVDGEVFRKAEGVIVITDRDGGLWIANKIRLEE